MLEAARDAGKIRFIGYSGDNERAAWAAACPLIDVIELSYNLADQYNRGAVLGIAQANGVGVIAKRPLANAAWQHADNPAAANEHHVTYARRFGHINLDHQAFGCASMGELALRYTLSVPGIHTAIASSTSPQRLGDNVAAAEQGALPPDVVQAIEAAFTTCAEVSRGTWLACN